MREGEKERRGETRGEKGREGREGEGEMRRKRGREKREGSEKGKHACTEREEGKQREGGGKIEGEREGG